MRICADSQITNATITWSNSRSFSPPNKLKIYQLVDKMLCTSGVTRGIIDFGSTNNNVNYFALCGTNISSSATVTLGYSNLDPDTPELEIPLPVFTNFNQIWFLPSPINRRYWMVDISDPSPQDSVGTEIGFVHMGAYTQIDVVDFPHVPLLRIGSVQAASPTYQEYGRKGTNVRSGEYICNINGSQIDVVLEKLAEIQSVDHVVVVPFENDIANNRYRPRYGILTAESYDYSSDGSSNLAKIRIPFEERF